MDGEIELIADGDGLAVIGETSAVERFLDSEGLPSKDMGLPRLKAFASAGSATAQVGSEVAGQSGRWVQLTETSAKLMADDRLRRSADSGLATGVVKGPKGQIAGFVEFSRTPGAVLTNPAMLAGVAGVMAQLAMQQTMDEIIDYLAKIDEKVDDILRSQQDAVLADMIGVDRVMEEAFAVREHVGRVSEVTWSKVQSTTFTLARTQAYALRQLDALAERLEKKQSIGDLADVAREAEIKVQDWLAVLAHCFQLQDAVGVLELDRVLDAAPDESNRHRLALRVARQRRLELIATTTQKLLTRMDAAAARANTGVLFNPRQSPMVVRSSNQVATAIHGLHGRLGIEHDRGSVETRRWAEAAGDAKARMIDVGSGGLDAARDRGSEAVDLAKSMTGRLTGRLVRRSRRPGDDPDHQTRD